jgi:predicted DNA-binding WGR domain protein
MRTLSSSATSPSEARRELFRYRHRASLPGRRPDSNKFYRVYEIQNDEEPFDFRILYNWGRWGATGQFKVDASAGAQTAAWTKAEEKQRKGYERMRRDTLPVIPADILERAGTVATASNGRSPAPVSADPFDALAADADRLIRLITGPAELSPEVVVLHSDLRSRLAELRARLADSEGRMELIADVFAAKVI